jgi:hypothetical protein
VGTATIVNPHLADHEELSDIEADLEPAIDVGSSFRAWWFLALAACSLCLAVAGTLLWFAKGFIGIPVLIAAALFSAATSFAAVAIASRKLAVRITPEGFIARDRRGERSFTDEQVICASLYSTANFTEGEQKSTTRVFDLWVEGEHGAVQFKMLNRIALGEDDPLETLTGRILRHLYERAHAALDERDSFEGEGWSLHSGELAILHKRGAEHIPVAELSAADVFDDELCLWKRGQDEPAARIPIRSANALILLRLLRDRIAAPGETAPPADGSRMGRILFERRPGRAYRALFWLLPLIAGLAVVVAIVAGMAGKVDDVSIVAIAVAIGVGCCWLMVLSQAVWFRCYEEGVSRRWLWWEKRVKYAEIESFTYSSTRQYVKGVYAGTKFSLTFVANTGRRPVKLAYSKTLRNVDHELDHLRDHVSGVIAARMLDQFGRGNPVDWTTGLRFLPEALEYQPRGWFRRKAPVMLRYDEIAGMDLISGVFHLWVNGQKKPAVKEQVGQPNFFPGYLVLSHLLTMQAAESAPEQ